MNRILGKHSDNINIFSLDLEMELSENAKINKHIIKLIDGKQSLYEPIYALNLVELEILKTYIETHLKTGFIQPSSSFARALIIFDKKLNGNFYLCIDY